MSRGFRNSERAPQVRRVLRTLTRRGRDLAVLPAASRTMALSRCLPFPTLRVSQGTVNGARESALPRRLPSSLNRTRRAPTPPDTDARTVTRPRTAARRAGAVILTRRGLVPG